MANFEQISHILFVFQLLTMNKQMPAKKLFLNINME